MDPTLLAARQRDLLFAFLETAEEPDLLSTPGMLADWLAGHGLMADGAEVTDDDLRQAKRVRAALFALLWANCGHELDPRVPVTLAALSAETPYTVTTAEDGSLALRPSGRPVPSALAELVAILYRAQVTREFTRWKACRKCAWPYFDSSKNQSRVWCDMQTCGSREKAKAYRHRRSNAV